jgi:SNF2 family DNA or RNA helicase
MEKSLNDLYSHTIKKNYYLTIENYSHKKTSTPIQTNEIDLPLTDTSDDDTIYYSVYYWKTQKSKLSSIEEGQLLVSPSSIVLLDTNSKEIIENPNKARLSFLENDEILKIDDFEIEIIKKLPKPLNSSDGYPDPNLSIEILEKLNESSDLNSPKDYLMLDEENNIFIEPFIQNKLRSYQIEGVKFMYDCISGKKVPGYNGCILADSMGLGKTLSTLTLLYTLTKKNASYTSGIKKGIIICPATLIENWESEVYKWFGNKLACTVCIGNKNAKTKKIEQFIKTNIPLLIISYEKFADFFSSLNKVCDIIVLDEGHKLKNHTAQKYQAIDGVRCLKRIILTGTPLQNYIREFFNCINLVNRNILGTWESFRTRYANVILKSQEPDAPEIVKICAAEVSEKLWDTTQKFMLRRTGDVVKHGLPPKHEYIVFLKILPLQETLYLSFLHSSIVDEVIQYGFNEDILALITILRKIINHPDLVYFTEPKSQAIKKDWIIAMNLFPPDYKSLSTRLEFSPKMQFVMELTEQCQKNSEKLIVVSNFTKTLDIIEKYYKFSKYQFIRLDGKTPTDKRFAIVKSFNEHYQSTVMLLSSKTGGCGLNLIGASRLIMFDADWNPSNDKQAMARIWREGQKKDVHVYRLISLGTIEEKIFQRQTSKEKLSLHVIDAKKASSKFTTEFIKKIFTYSTKIDSFVNGNDPKALKGSWLDLLKVDIEMVKEIKSEFEEVTEEQCIMQNPVNEIVEPYSVSSVEKSIKKRKIK